MHVATARLAPFSIITIADREAGLPAWQSMFAWPAHGDAHVAHRSDTQADRNILATKLDAAVARADRGVLLVAEGASCFATAWWARLSPASYVSRVAGALLFSPLDEEDGNRFVGNLRKFASPKIALPFPSIVIDSPSAERDARLRDIVQDWGSRSIAATGAPRDVNSGVRPWRQAQRMIERFTSAVVANDILKADKLRGT